MKLTLLCDDREKAVIKELHLLEEEEHLPLNIIIKRLTIGDFIVSKRKAIERKRGDDLVATIMDGREEEFIRLKETYPEAVVIIEDFDRAFNTRSKIHINSIYGFLSKLEDEKKGYGLKTLPTRDTKDTARLLIRMAFREQKDKEFTGLARKKAKFEPFDKLVGEKRTIMIRKYQTWFLQGLIGIGKEKVVMLLDTFKTPWAVLNAYGTTNIRFLHGHKKFNKSTKLSKLRLIGVKNVWNNREMLLTNTYQEEN